MNQHLLSGLNLSFIAKTLQRGECRYRYGRCCLECHRGRFQHHGISELRGFAQSLKKDYEAVKAGLTLSWSQGPVEGHVHRLKLLKRQAYGRASFQMLRKRVLRCS